MREPAVVWSKPERFLVLLARGGAECRGKVVRLADSSELRFESMEELVAWLQDQARPQRGPGR